ncbi:hypothetical protein A2311_06460 [candidate division WOR-1 bacterium RIFOXYB2_FULL_48_7]|uniref:SpoVT-AbrB domain-containing protein n=1 Tax=candidate division WOR-1 bacterium RIFOXYB2_FULL_48_7 TaxID=1802583 RepID=A0A1F4TA45_UNCSA|nr:MAG: hypothetical protein A2311_06460 [candidate division WOR-1 bacterium RIFOXYB2_FULL_48_7]HII17452.1 phosphate uptake regulator PhoU [Candidatus Woesearchaeota archaeon]HII68767.1 phosphate uptake regulator PhoU [Candidatus Woesearchaeota archaeon]
MKRKVIRQGHGTLTITLPAKWVEQNGVKAGDELKMEERERTLFLNSNGRDNDKITIDITDCSLILERLLYSIYKKGYDEVEIFSSNPRHFLKVQEAAHSILVGFEIVSQTKSSCIIKRIAAVQTEEFDNILSRTFFQLNIMLSDMAAALEKSDITLLESIRLMEITNNRYTGFCRRALNKGDFGNIRNQKFLYCMIEYLEKVADEVKYLCLYLQEFPKKIENIPKHVTLLFHELQQLFEKTMRLYSKFSMDSLLALYSQRKKLIKSANSLFTGNNCRTGIYGHYLLSMTQEIADVMAFILSMQHQADEK